MATIKDVMVAEECVKTLRASLSQAEQRLEILKREVDSRNAAPTSVPVIERFIKGASKMKRIEAFVLGHCGQSVRAVDVANSMPDIKRDTVFVSLNSLYRSGRLRKVAPGIYAAPDQT